MKKICLIALTIIFCTNAKSQSVGFFKSNPSLDWHFSIGQYQGRSEYYSPDPSTKQFVLNASQNFNSEMFGMALHLNQPIINITDDFSIGASTGFLFNLEGSDGVHFMLPLLLQLKYGGDATSDCEKQFGVGLAMGVCKNAVSINADGWYNSFIIAPEVMYSFSSVHIKAKLNLPLSGEQYVTNSSPKEFTKKMWLTNPWIFTIGPTFEF